MGGASVPSAVLEWWLPPPPMPTGLTLLPPLYILVGFISLSGENLSAPGVKTESLVVPGSEDETLL
jgi:hypothetical protein